MTCLEKLEINVSLDNDLACTTSATIDSNRMGMFFFSCKLSL